MKARLCTLVVILGASVACFGQDSLGDVARAQRASERPKAKRVVTNENLPHASPSEAANGAVVLPKAPESKNDADAKSDDKAADKKQASLVMTPADAQKKLEELKGTEEAQQRALKKFEEELKDESIGPERRLMFEQGLQAAKQMLGEVAADREKIEKAIAAVAAASADPSKKQDSASPQETAREERPADNAEKNF